mgnify:FL=1
MNPETRKLLRIDINDLLAADLEIDRLMGDDSALRKK